LTTGDGVGATAVKGIVEFVNCNFENSLGAGIVINGKTSAGCGVKFRNCELRNCLVDKSEQSPIQIVSLPGGAGDVGGVAFENCRVKDPVERLPLSYKDMNGDRELVDITGRLSVTSKGRTRLYKLGKEQIDAWFPGQAGINSVSPFNMEGVRWETLVGNPVPGQQYSFTARLRDGAEYLLWADSGREVDLVIHVDSIGKGKKPLVKVRMVTPSGKTVKLSDATAGRQSYKFKADEVGVHRLICESGSDAIRIVSSNSPVCVYSGSGSMHLFGSQGEYFFYVPKNVKEFIVRVAGSSAGELVKATLTDSAEIGRAHV